MITREQENVIKRAVDKAVSEGATELAEWHIGEATYDKSTGFITVPLFLPPYVIADSNV